MPEDVIATAEAADPDTMGAALISSQALRPRSKPKAEPGSVTIRPTLADAESRETDFYDLLEYIRSHKGLTHKVIGDVIGDKSANVETTISKKISGRKFDQKDRKAILDYIFKDGSLLSGPSRHKIAQNHDALYFAFLNHCDIKENSQDSARARLVGTYKLWRYSVEHDGEFVFGKLVFSEDPKTRALKVDMVQPKLPRHGVRGSVERLSGYMFRVSHMHMMLLTDHLTRDVRMTIFPRAKLDEIGTEVNERSVFQGRHVHIIHMDGFGLGIDGSTGFFSPVHISLVDDVDELDALDDLLDIVPLGDRRVPERVVRKLERNGPLRRL